MSEQSAKPKYRYRLLTDKMIITDIRFMSALAKGKLTDVEVIDWLEDHIEGGVGHLPMTEFSAVIEDAFAQYYATENPTDTEGKA